jgi:hypothetical protein
MVALVRSGESQRSVARRFRVGLATVQLWLERSRGLDLDRVDWNDRSSARHHRNRTPIELEDQILALRTQLKKSLLGDHGAEAIRRALIEAGHARETLPTVRTIGRILERRGAVDGRWRTRRPPPPRGWYLPDVAAWCAELDSFDLIDELRLPDGRDLDVLTGVSLHGGLPVAWPELRVTADTAVRAFTRHWREVGLPGYAQFDNDARFIGSGNRADGPGSVIRLCLALGVVPVFAPPRETGFQAAIESFNGRWQAKLWQRSTGLTLGALRVRSAAWIAADRRRSAVRIEVAPERAAWPLPGGVLPDLDARPSGRIVFLRRTDRRGTVSVFNRPYHVDRQWPHRLVRAELDLDDRRLRCYALRRREPAHQPLLRDHTYQPSTPWLD